MKKIIPIILIVLIAFGIFFVYLPYTRIKAKGMVLVASAKELKAALKENNIDLLNGKLNTFKLQYADFRKESAKVYWLSFIPYVADFKNGVEGGSYLLMAGQDAIDAITPYADLIGFKKGTTSFAEKPVEDRLQTAVLTLDKVLGKLDSISANIKNAEDKFNQINPDRYPEKIGSLIVKNNIVNAKEQFGGLSSLFVDAKPLLKNLPTILGKDEEKTYLILFQNDKELRATGGFLTAYAVFKINSGKITIVKSEDIYSLDNSISGHPAAPPEILTYHKNVSQFYIRDSNLSPDFPSSVKLFNSLYDKSNEKVNYDGIVALDSKILVTMLDIFGDKEVDGVVFSAKNIPECDCPQVIYKLFDMVDRPVNYVKENRKGILGDLMYTLFRFALGTSPSKYWGTLAEMMFKNLNEKHILLYFTDPTVQAAVAKLNYAGTIKEYDGDYLHVSNVNFAGAKSNLFVNQTVSSKTTVASGKIEREVTVEFRNPYPASDCNLERGGLCLNATLRNWIRFYVPLGAQLKDFQGSQKKVNTYNELGKTVFEGFLTVDPLGKATVIVTYTLPADIKAGDYSLLVQKQPGTDDQKLKIVTGGRTVYDGILSKDVEIKEKL